MVVSYESAPRAAGWARKIVDYNPFYVLSAMFMLAGLFALNDSLDWSPLPMFNVLMLITALNLYELLLIGLGTFLLSRGLYRDAVTLFVIEAFFLVDGGFLNAEIFTQDFHVGVGVNLALLILALLKVAAMFRALRLPLASGPFALALVQLAVLFAMPGVFKFAAADRFGSLPPLVLYGYWWVVGAVVAAWGILLRRTNFSTGPTIDHFGKHRVVIGSLLILGLVSILAHLCTSNFVYDVRWYAANIAPFVLGIAVASTFAGPSFGLQHASRLRFAISLPVLAVLLSGAFSTTLEIPLNHVIVLSPLRFALVAAAISYVQAMIVWRQALFGVGFVGSLVIAGIGHTTQEIGRNLAMIIQALWDAIAGVVPRTAVHWGVTSVAVAFVLLAAGFVLSLLRARWDQAQFRAYLDARCEPLNLARSVGPARPSR